MEMTHTRQPARLLSAGEVARLAQVSLRAVRGWADKGKLESFRTLGGHRRFREDDVAALLRTYTSVKIERNYWLTVSQVAHALGVSAWAVREWASAGTLPCEYTPGGHRRFRRDDVERHRLQANVQQKTFC